MIISIGIKQGLAGFFDFLSFSFVYLIGETLSQGLQVLLAHGFAPILAFDANWMEEMATLGGIFWMGVWFYLNQGVFQGWGGGTLGKMVLGIHVLREDGKYLGIRFSLLRSLLSPLFFVKWRGRALHDQFFKSVVIERELQSALLKLPAPVSVIHLPENQKFEKSA